LILFPFLERCFLIPEETYDPYENLAIEKELFEKVKSGKIPNFFRIWRNRKSVIIGISPESKKEVRSKICFALGIPIVRRFTGGGAVYHDLGNINWTVALRSTLKSSSLRNPLKIYREFGGVVLRILEKFGLRGKIFKNSVFVKNRKICGMAAYISSDSLLCHSTFLVNSDLEIMRRVLKMKFPVINLKELLNEEIDINKVVNLLIETFKEEFKIAEFIEVNSRQLCNSS